MHEIAELADECTVFRNGSNVATYRRGNEVRRRGRRDDDRPRTEPRLSAEAAAARRRSDAAARSQEPRLGGSAARHFLSCARGRSRRARRPRRAGPARAVCLRYSACCAASRAKSASRAEPVAPSSPHAAKSPQVGMALIPEDRKTEGLMLPMSAARKPLLRGARAHLARRHDRSRPRRRSSSAK